MGGRPPGLPDFERPPVVEVVLSVQFEGLETLRTAHLGLLWAEFRDRFPKTEEQGPLLSVIERFDRPSAPQVGLRVETMFTPPVPRIWFLNESGTELIQVQTDRFIHNWRGTEKGAEYPRYESVRESFHHEFEKFTSFVSREKLGQLTINQCEVTYVNHVVSGEGWTRHGEISEIVSLWNSTARDAALPPLEDASLLARFVVLDAAGKPAGRLYVELQPAWRVVDSRPIYVLRLVARGRPQGEGTEGALGFFDFGRKSIVEGFAAITTPRMQKIWRRIDDR